MKYYLASAKYSHDFDSMTELKKLGFKFKKIANRFNIVEDSSIEINSIEELQDFINTWGKVIVSKERITIYNDYME